MAQNCCCRRASLTARCETVDLFLLDSLGLPDATLRQPTNVSEPELKTWDVDYAVRADADCTLSLATFTSQKQALDWDGTNFYFNLSGAVVKRSGTTLELIWQKSATTIGHTSDILSVHCVTGGVVTFSLEKVIMLDSDGAVVWTTSLPTHSGRGASDETIYVYSTVSGNAYFYNVTTGAQTTVSMPSGLVIIYRTENNVLYARPAGATSVTKSYDTSFSVVTDYTPLNAFGQVAHVEVGGLVLNTFFNNTTGRQGALILDVSDGSYDELIARDSGDPDITVTVPDTGGLTFDRRSNSIYCIDSSYYYGTLTTDSSVVAVIDVTTDAPATGGTLRVQTTEGDWLTNLRFRKFGSKYLAISGTELVLAREVNF